MGASTIQAGDLVLACGPTYLGSVHAVVSPFYGYYTSKHRIEPEPRARPVVQWTTL